MERGRGIKRGSLGAQPAGAECHRQESGLDGRLHFRRAEIAFGTYHDHYVAILSAALAEVTSLHLGRAVSEAPELRLIRMSLNKIFEIDLLPSATEP